MNLETTGTLVWKGDTQQVSEKFKKREFVIKISEEINGQTYTNFGKFQLVQNKCDTIDQFHKGDVLRVHFNIRGHKWERDGKVNYITNLDAWKIESAAGQGQQNENIPVYSASHTTNGGSGYASPATPHYQVIDNDLPF